MGNLDNTRGETFLKSRLGSDSVIDPRSRGTVLRRVPTHSPGDSVVFAAQSISIPKERPVLFVFTSIDKLKQQRGRENRISSN